MNPKPLSVWRDLVIKALNAAIKRLTKWRSDLLLRWSWGTDTAGLQIYLEREEYRLKLKGEWPPKPVGRMEDEENGT